VGIEVISAMDFFPGRQFGVDSGASEEVESEFSLGDGPVPQVHWDVTCGVPTCCQVILGSSNGSLCCIASVVIVWGQLVLDVSLVEVILDLLGAFIVHSVIFGLATSCGQSGVDAFDGCCK
jgi:hypothetical protein